MGITDQVLKVRTVLKEDDKAELLARPLMVVSADCGLASTVANR